MGRYSREINVQNALQKQNKNESKKRFVRVTEKYLKIEEYLNKYGGKLFKGN